MSEETTRAERFLGMTKFQFMGCMMVLLAILFVGTVYNLSFAVRENRQRIAEIDDAATQIQQNQRTIGLLLEQSEQDHMGLCEFIADLDRRVDSSRKLLSEHQGEPMIFGIPRETIEQSVSNQGQTLNALRPVDCTDVKIDVTP